jgi:hypothetical protein
MPTPNPPAKDYLFNQISDLQARVRSLEQQPKSQTVAQTINTGQSTSSSTDVDLATVGPSVTVSVGASQSVVVTVTASIFGIGAGAVSLYLNGSLYVANILVFNTGATAGATFVLTTSIVVSGLNPGPNTFLMRYNNASSGASTTFSARTLVAVPL